ncbi:MAG: hypothetical protein VZS44_09015 [Bacilli bacterium]|nr:hypothetical protein [Bacilli bacterium]
MRRIFLFCFLFLFGMSYVNAASCDNDDIARLKGVAFNVSYNSEYIGNKSGSNDYQLYNVSFVGLTDEIYVSDSNYSFFVYNNNEVIKMQSGNNSLEIYSKNCGDVRLKTLTINLPKFNNYSLSSDCSDIDIKEFELCDPWYQGNITDEVFRSRLNEYLDSKEVNNNVEKKEFNISYLVIVISVVVIVGIIGVIIFRYKKNKLD